MDCGPPAKFESIRPLLVVALLLEPAPSLYPTNSLNHLKSSGCLLRKVEVICTNSCREITSWLKSTRQRRKFSYTSGLLRALRTLSKKANSLSVPYLPASARDTSRSTPILGFFGGGSETPLGGRFPGTGPNFPGPGTICWPGVP